jgi:hypothetical protein
MVKEIDSNFSIKAKLRKKGPNNDRTRAGEVCQGNHL